MKKNIPNIITAVRIIGAVVMIFIEPLTHLFFVFYFLCGLSDAADGIAARALKAQSDLGSRLDSVADLSFYAVMFIKIFPRMLEVLELYIWLIGITALLIRLMSYVLVAVKYRRFSSLHTIPNKTAGLMVFLIPFFLATNLGSYYCLIAAIVSNIAAIHELILHLSNNSYRVAKDSIRQEE